MSAHDSAEAAQALVTASLDTPATTTDLARQSYRSRTQFHRWFRAVVEETPQAMRRRLLLERAAWQLIYTAESVTGIAFDAGYGSLEAFTRAFGKAFGASPSMYRRMRVACYHLAASNGIHFQSASRTKGASSMDLFDRFSGNDSWHTKRLLEYAAKLTDEQLDRPLPGATEILPWREKTDSLRQILENIIWTKEVWVAALLGKTPKDGFDATGTKPPDRTPARMLERLEQVDADFDRIFRQVGSRGAWDDEFIDALCEPPENFTYGGVFAHIMTFNAHRRIMAIDALRQFGINPKGFGDPMEYEQSMEPSASVKT
jgi:AraC-like DNA-binding protein/uncharacterized damage-inducible protein DinB